MSQHTSQTDQQEDNGQHEQPEQQGETDQQESQQDSGQEQSSPSRTAAEWAVFAVAALVLAAVVAVITADALDTHGPPSFSTTAGAVADRNDAHYVTVAVENTGDITASDVKVGAQLRQDGRVVEQATQMIGFLAGDGMRQVTFVFEHDPRALDLRTGVTSFGTT